MMDTHPHFLLPHIYMHMYIFRPIMKPSRTCSTHTKMGKDEHAQGPLWLLRPEWRPDTAGLFLDANYFVLFRFWRVLNIESRYHGGFANKIAGHRAYELVSNKKTYGLFLRVQPIGFRRGCLYRENVWIHIFCGGILGFSLWNPKPKTPN